MTASNGLGDINIPHALAKVDRIWMVRLVHAQGFRVVVDGDIRRAPKGHFNSRAGSSTSGEVVDDHSAGRWVGFVLFAGGTHAAPPSPAATKTSASP
jgi:hypothetical protein